MAISCLEQIAQAIEPVLNELVVAGKASLVERTRRVGVPTSPRDQALYLYQDNPAEADESETPPGFRAWLQPFIVDCFVVPSDDATTPVDTEINRLRCCVETKLGENARLNFGLPGLVIEAEIEDSIMFTASNGVFAGVRVTAVVQYRTREDDPYAYT